MIKFLSFGSKKAVPDFTAGLPNSLARFLKSVPSSPTRGALTTMARNWTELASEARRSVQFADWTVLAALLATAVGIQAQGQTTITSTVYGKEIACVAPALAAAVAAVAIAARVIYQSQVKDYRESAAGALARVSLTPAYKGCGVLRGLFNFLFAKDEEGSIPKGQGSQGNYRIVRA